MAAVDHVSFDPHPGELLGLLGPNAAGKKTFLLVFASLQRALRRQSLSALIILQSATPADAYIRFGAQVLAMVAVA